MHPRARTAAPARRITWWAVALALLLLAGSVPGAAALWSVSSPAGPSGLATGSLALDQDALGPGAWTLDGSPFTSTDPMPAGATLTYTVPDVPVTAIGDNLVAAFHVHGAGVPEELAPHVAITASADPVLGARSGTDGSQRVCVALQVTTSADLPGGGHVLDLTALTVTLTNGRGWSDTATLDAGTLRTGPAAPGGVVTLTFDLSRDEDGVVGFYLDDPGPETSIYVWGVGFQPAVDGLNTVRPLDVAQVAIIGTFRGFGSPEQTREQIGSLREVKGWTDDVGSTSAAHAFQHAENLISVDTLPRGLVDTSYAFAGAGTAEAFWAIVAPGWQPERVRTMAHMFDGAGTIAWDVVRDWDTSAVRSMAGMFHDAGTFNADISGWDTSGVTDMTGMFHGATVFDQDLSGWDVDRVVAWDDFATGSALTEDHLPVKFRGTAVGSTDPDGGSRDDVAAGDAIQDGATGAGTPGTPSQGGAAAENDPEAGTAGTDAAPGAGTTEDETTPATGTAEEDGASGAGAADQDTTGAGSTENHAAPASGTAANDPSPVTEAAETDDGLPTDGRARSGDATASRPRGLGLPRRPGPTRFPGGTR